VNPAKKGPVDVDNFTGFDERCVQLFKVAHEYHAAGFSNRKIAKLLRVSRPTVIKYINGDFEALCRKTLRSGMDSYHDYIVKSLKAGMSRKDIYRKVVAMGFEGKQTGAYDYMNKLIAHYGIEFSVYRSTSADAIQKRKRIEEYDYITRTALFRFLWMNAELPPDHKEYIFNNHPQLHELYVCIKEFRQIFEKGWVPLLYMFIEKYKRSNQKALAVFSKGLEKDIEAVENAVSCALSNGFVEGTISKLKMTKRVMYGRCSRSLLAAKMMYEPGAS
jgi:predicted transcriptional regulator